MKTERIPGFRNLGAVLICCGIAAGVSGPARAEPLGAEEVLSRLQNWLDDTRDLEGRFEQRLESGAFGDAVAESGRVWISRPGKMRWEYLEPERKLALVRDGKTWLYLEEDRQLMLGLLDRETELLPALLAGDGRLGALFEPTLEAGSGDGEYRLKLVPRGGSESLEELIVSTASPSFEVRRIEVLDAAGNRVSYGFSEIRRNRGLNDDLFRFEPEPGVEVSGSHGP